MSVKVSRNFTALSAIALTTVEDMREIGLLARERIYNRTIAGKDAEGNTFAPYSEGYAKAKGSTFVDLTVSGNMLNQMQIVEVDEDSVSLGWEP
jgi:hypothetical protein